MPEIKTNPNYWNCECEQNYIHRKLPGGHGWCASCEAFEDEMPDSHAVEVDAMLNGLATQEKLDICIGALKALLPIYWQLVEQFDPDGAIATHIEFYNAGYNAVEVSGHQVTSVDYPKENPSKI